MEDNAPWMPITPIGPLWLAIRDQAIVGLAWGPLAGIGDDWAAQPLAQEARLWMAAYFRGDRPPMDLPLAPGGSRFQQRVWHLTAAIPLGQCRTYGALAQDLFGSSRAARAVGQAMAANPIPILIPCHRVVAAAAGGGGYSGGAGLATKALLLRLENDRSSSMRDF